MNSQTETGEANLPMHIVLAFDQAYAPHGGAAIASILESAEVGGCMEFHILDSGVSEDVRDRLQDYVQARGCKIDFIKISLDQFSLFPTTSHAAAAYSRLLIAELLPGLNRALYLDSDLVVLKALNPLWQTRLNGAAAAVVRDAADVFGSHFLAHKQRLGLRLDQPAFNSGVMLIDLALWRKASIGATVADWIKKNKDLMRHSDQCALNAILKDRVQFVDPIWNVQTPLIRAVHYGWIRHPEWVDAVRSPAIVHYTTSSKPWDFSRAVPRRKDYSRCRRLQASGQAASTIPTFSIIMRRAIAEAIELRHWLASLLKGRLRPRFALKTSG